MRKPILFLALLSVAGSAWAGGQGTTAASFLQLDTSPRVVGMGDSFAGLADDASAIEYNPAGQAYLTQKYLTVMDAVWFQDITYQYGAIAWPFKFGTVSADFFYLNAGTFQGYTASGTPTGTFTAADMYGTLAYSRKILRNLSAGLSVKFLSESISTYSTSSVALGLSAFYQLPYPGLSLGMSLNNLGPSEGFQQGYALPLNLRMGVGYKPFDNIDCDIDYTQPNDTAGTLSLGGEYGYRALVFRLGYKFQGQADYNQTESGFGPAAAAGLNFGMGVKFFTNFTLDYSYSYYGFLGASQRFSLGAKFD